MAAPPALRAPPLPGPAPPPCSCAPVPVHAPRLCPRSPCLCPRASGIPTPLPALPSPESLPQLPLERQEAAAVGRGDADGHLQHRQVFLVLHLVPAPLAGRAPPPPPPPQTQPLQALHRSALGHPPPRRAHRLPLRPPCVARSRRRAWPGTAAVRALRPLSAAPRELGTAAHRRARPGGGAKRALQRAGPHPTCLSFPRGWQLIFSRLWP